MSGALDALGADRIQHGVRAIEDPELVKRLADSDVCLDVCPTSNVLLVGVPRPSPTTRCPPARRRRTCSVNADDPLLFGPGLLEEYELARSDLGFDDDALAHDRPCSIEASGAPDEVKAPRAGIDAWLTVVRGRGRHDGDRGPDLGDGRRGTGVEEVLVEHAVRAPAAGGRRRHGAERTCVPGEEHGGALHRLVRRAGVGRLQIGEAPPAPHAGRRRRTPGSTVTAAAVTTRQS